MGDCCEVNGWHLYTLLEDDEWVTHWQPMPEAPAAANDIVSEMEQTLNRINPRRKVSKSPVMK